MKFGLAAIVIAVCELLVTVQVFAVLSQLHFPLYWKMLTNSLLAAFEQSLMCCESVCGPERSDTVLWPQRLGVTSRRVRPLQESAAFRLSVLSP